MYVQTQLTSQNNTEVAFAGAQPSGKTWGYRNGDCWNYWLTTSSPQLSPVHSLGTICLYAALPLLGLECVWLPPSSRLVALCHVPCLHGCPQALCLPADHGTSPGFSFCWGLLGRSEHLPPHRPALFCLLNGRNIGQWMRRPEFQFWFHYAQLCGFRLVI